MKLSSPPGKYYLIYFKRRLRRVCLTLLKALQLGYSDKHCTGCKSCAKICPNDVHTFTSYGKHTINFTACRQCGKCVDVCPSGALKIYGKEMTSEEIIKTVMKDINFHIRGYIAKSNAV